MIKFCCEPGRVVLFALINKVILHLELRLHHTKLWREKNVPSGNAKESLKDKLDLKSDLDSQHKLALLEISGVFEGSGFHKHKHDSFATGKISETFYDSINIDVVDSGFY